MSELLDIRQILEEKGDREARMAKGTSLLQDRQGGRTGYSCHLQGQG